MRSLAKSIAAVSFVLAFLGVSTAYANILALKARTGSYVIPDSGPVFVPLDDNGATDLNFEVSDKGYVVITYNVECAATGDPGAWIGLQILVDGKLTKAGLGDFAICSATEPEYIYTAVSRQSFIKLKPGPHSVQVRVSREGATNGRLDDGSIVIMN